MKILEMTTKADELMTVFPKGKKKIVISGVAALCILAILFALIGNSPERPSADQPRSGSDLKDLAAARPITGTSIRGTVTINNQIPLPRGFVVAYLESMNRMIASSPIQQDGTYKLDNVPPISLVLVVKPKLTDDPKIEEASNVMPGLPDARNIGGKRGNSARRDPNKAEPPLFQGGKQPTKAALSKIKADVVTPDMAALPEVRWLIDYAFYKFDGSNPNAHKFIVPEGEGEKIFFMPLIVP